MQALSRREDQAVIEQARREGKQQCAEVMKAFTDCADGRTFTVVLCRGKYKAWESCMQQYVTEEKLDEIRADYIAHRSERGKEAVENYKKERIESMKRHAGIKDEPLAAWR